jgi:hypothetical protein
MEEKHKATVEKKPVVLPGWILRKLDRIVDEIFYPGWDKVAKYEPDFSFTGSSCLQKSRSEGGSLAFWKEALDEEFSGRPMIVVTDVEGNTSWPELVDFHGKKVDEFQLQERYDAKAECVEDPLKIRIITKNDANFSLLKGLQRAMWNHLQRFPCFLFTGTPAAGEYMKLFFSTLGLNSKNSLFISGDYSAATDNLPPQATISILERILNNTSFGGKVSEKLAKMALDSVTFHRIKYNYIEDAVQTNGQMMGCLLSFPVLCVYILLCGTSRWRSTFVQRYKHHGQLSGF